MVSRKIAVLVQFFDFLAFLYHFGSWRGVLGYKNDKKSRIARSAREFTGSCENKKHATNSYTSNKKRIRSQLKMVRPVIIMLRGGGGRGRGGGGEGNEFLFSGERYHSEDVLLFPFSQYLPLRVLRDTTVGLTETGSYGGGSGWGR